jgi:hypothetical protein
MSRAHGPVIDAWLEAGGAADRPAAGWVQLVEEALECSTQ